jgi:hypothetical protein
MGGRKVNRNINRNRAPKTTISIKEPRQSEEPIFPEKNKLIQPRKYRSG